MKVKVLKIFRDKHTGKVYKPGEILNLKKERADEIMSADKTLIEEKKGK